MARKRIIDPEFWSDEEIGLWSHSARLFYIGLWNFADDEGRFKAHKDLLKSQIFPYDKKIDIEKLKKELGSKIYWYSINGSTYGEVVNFHKYQRIDKPQASKIPSPNENIISPPLTKEIIEKITERDKKICQYCGKKADDLVIDHIIPWSRGGRHYPENLVVACRSCNSIKRDKILTEMPKEFIATIYNKDLYTYSEKNIEASKLSSPNIIEVKLSKDKLIEDYVDFEKSTFASWNSFCEKYPTLSKIKEISTDRRVKLKKRYEAQSFKDFGQILQAAKDQAFLFGENDRKWKFTFDWLIENNTNYLKVLEGRYKSKSRSEIKAADPECKVCNGSGFASIEGVRNICPCRRIK